MANIEKSVVINASSDAIDAYAIDANTWTQWFEGAESVQVDDTFPEEGGKVVVSYKASGMSFDITMTSQEVVHGSHLVMRMEGMINGTQSWRYTEEGDATRVDAMLDYEMSGGGLGAIADKLIVERMNKSNLGTSLTNLKRIVEG
ncbi:MAG: SRPBCC family protein [Aggregatilineales bacterium]